jgi:hypothetical protein
MELSKDEIKAILVLIGRTNLNGNEVPTFNYVVNKLNQMLQEPVVNVKSVNHEGGITAGEINNVNTEYEKTQLPTLLS